MARFQFRLKPIRELRQHIEREFKDELMRERQKLTGLQDEGRRLSGEFLFWAKQYMKNAETGISPQEVARINAYIEELNRLIEENSRQTAEQSAVVEKTRLELIEKMQERKALDSLYEKQFSSYTENERHKDEIETEEIITGRLYASH